MSAVSADPDPDVFTLMKTAQQDASARSQEVLRGIVQGPAEARASQLQKSVIETLFDPLKASRMRPEHWCACYSFLRLQFSTQNGTMSQLNTLHKHGCSGTPLGLMHFIMKMETGEVKKRAHSTLCSVKNALARAAATVGVYFDQGKWQQLKGCLDTYSIRNPPRQRMKGAIDFDQFLQLIDFVQNSAEDHLEERLKALTVHYAFGFRGTWVSVVNRTHFSDRANGEWEYRGSMDKAPTRVRASGVQKIVIMTCMPELHEDIDAMMRKVAATNADPMFPNYSTRWATKIVKAAAKKFDWNHMLHWSGSHCLRHGSAVEAAGPEGDVMKAAQRIGTTPENALRYMITNKDREAISRLRAAGLGGPNRRGPKSKAALEARAAVLDAAAEAETKKKPVVWKRDYTKKCVQKKRREKQAQRLRMASAKKAQQRAGKR